MAITTAAEVARLADRLPAGMSLERGEEIHDSIRMAHAPGEAIAGVETT